MWTRGNLPLVCVCAAPAPSNAPMHAPTDYPTSEMEEGEFIKTQNEGELFMHKNYLYTINSVCKRDPMLKFYTCVVRKTCGGRVHLQDGKYLKTVTEHFHLADQAKVEAKSHPNVFKP